MKGLSVVLVSVLLTVLANAQDNDIDGPFLCIADMATGFIYENDKWNIAKFAVSDSRYIVRRPNSDDRHSDAAWVWGRFGKKSFTKWCEKEINEYGNLFCAGIMEELWINVNTLRYQRVYTFGYVQGGDSSNDTPFIEIGTCSAL